MSCGDWINRCSNLGDCVKPSRIGELTTNTSSHRVYHASRIRIGRGATHTTRAGISEWRGDEHHEKTLGGRPHLAEHDRRAARHLDGAADRGDAARHALDVAD